MGKKYNLSPEQEKLIKEVENGGSEGFFRGVVITKLSHIENTTEEMKLRCGRHSTKILHNRVTIAMMIGGLIVIGILLKCDVIIL